MITSPCTNICKIDTSNGLCQGCFRTLDEITAWSRIDDSARSEILADIAKRRLAHASQKGLLHSDGNPK